MSRAMCPTSAIANHVRHLLLAFPILVASVRTPTAANGVIYFGDSGVLYRVDTDGHNLVNLLGVIDLECVYIGIAYDVAPGMLYWTDRCWPEGSSSLWRIQPEGSTVGILRHVQLDSVLVGVAIDPGHGKLYWTLATSSGNPGLIQRSNLDGSGAQTLTDSAGVRLRGLRVDPVAGKVYWTTYRDDAISSGVIRRMDLDGQNLEDLITGLGKPQDVALDVGGGKLYWTDSGTGKIQRANLTDGGNVQDLVSGLAWAYGIDVDSGAGKVYWTARDRIQRANLDGSNVETVLTGLGDAYHLDVVTQTPAAADRLGPSGRFTVQVLPNAGSHAGATLLLRLPRDGLVSVDLYTVAGQRVVRLLDATRSAGVHAVSWPGSDGSGHAVASGVYLYKARLDDEVVGGKLLLVR